MRRERATQRVDGFRNAHVQFHPPDALAAATFGDGPDRILRPGAGEDLPGAIILPRREEMSRQLEAEATVAPVTTTTLRGIAVMSPSRQVRGRRMNRNAVPVRL